MIGANARILDVVRLGAKPDSGQDVGNLFGSLGLKARALVAEFDRLRAGQPERFQLVAASDLARPVAPMQWLVRGVWPEGSYGVLAGEKKTNKTWTLLALMLAVASGEPFLGHFEVPAARPVLMYLGEGGRNPTMRRLQRLAVTMGVDLASLPLHMAFDAGDITGPEFVGKFTRHVEEVQPGLVIVDPLYAFHPPDVEVQNLYARGALLSEIRQMVPEGIALIIADHFKKTGDKALDLDSVAQAGIAQWSDSWALQQHAEPPLVDEGRFRLAVQFGSRQWGGREYDVAWDLGRFDEDTSEHIGELSYEVAPRGWGTKPSKGGVGGLSAADIAKAHIVTLLEARPAALTKNESESLVMVQASCSRQAFRDQWTVMADAGVLVSEVAEHTEAGTARKRTVWRYVAPPVEKLRVGGDGAE